MNFSFMVVFILNLIFVLNIGANELEKHIMINYKNAEGGVVTLDIELKESRISKQENILAISLYDYVHPLFTSVKKTHYISAKRFYSIWNLFLSTRLNAESFDPIMCRATLSYNFNSSPQEGKIPSRRVYCLDLRPWHRSTKEAFNLYLALEREIVKKP